MEIAAQNKKSNRTLEVLGVQECEWQITHKQKVLKEGRVPYFGFISIFCNLLPSRAQTGGGRRSTRSQY